MERFAFFHVEWVSAYDFGQITISVYAFRFICEYFYWLSVAHGYGKLYESRLMNILKHVQYSSWKVL